MGRTEVRDWPARSSVGKTQRRRNATTPYAHGCMLATEVHASTEHNL